jgi:hypothetical protein
MKALPISLIFFLFAASAIAQDPAAGSDSLFTKTTFLEISLQDQAAVNKFRNEVSSFTELSTLTISGAFDSLAIEQLVQTAARIASLKELRLYNNDLQVLPASLNLLATVQILVLHDNDDLDLQRSAAVLNGMPSLKKLETEIYTIHDVESVLPILSSLSEITLINKDEFISDSEFSSFNGEPAHFRYELPRTGSQPLGINYISLAGILDNDEAKALSEQFEGKKNYNGSGASYEFIPKYRNVTPPIEGIDVERSLYVINPSLENTLIYPSGTRLYIPPDAFRTPAGTLPSGNVTISYREFRDPVDCLVSGIPMRYDTAGAVETFESAGMFEINAGDRNGRLELAPEKRIE